MTEKERKDDAQRPSVSLLFAHDIPHALRVRLTITEKKKAATMSPNGRT
jgi:hypothetical protein